MSFLGGSGLLGRLVSDSDGLVGGSLLGGPLGNDGLQRREASKRKERERVRERVEGRNDSQTSPRAGVDVRERRQRLTL